MKTPSQYISSLPKLRTAFPTRSGARRAPGITRLIGQRSLYYPGSGTDSAPLNLFTQAHFVSTVIYSDYTITLRQVRKFLTNLDGWTIETEEALNPKDFGGSGWADFWPAHQAAQQPAQPKNAFGTSAILVDSSTRRKVNFLLLATEGIMTYARLLDVGFRPALVVVQDHGFGCNWTQFGGSSMLFDIARNNLPRLIYVGENTTPWPGYKQVSEYGTPEGSGGHRRALYSTPRRRSAT